MLIADSTITMAAANQQEEEDIRQATELSLQEVDEDVAEAIQLSL